MFCIVCIIVLTLFISAQDCAIRVGGIAVNTNLLNTIVVLLVSNIASLFVNVLGANDKGAGII